MEDKNLFKFQNNLFTFVVVFSWILYFSILTGISTNAPKYLNIYDYYIKIYVSLFLLWRFNPFKTKIVFNELDRKIAFTAGVFLFTTTSLNQFLLNYLDKTKYVLIDKKEEIKEQIK